MADLRLHMTFQHQHAFQMIESTSEFRHRRLASTTAIYHRAHSANAVRCMRVDVILGSGGGEWEWALAQLDQAQAFRGYCHPIRRACRTPSLPRCCQPHSTRERCAALRCHAPRNTIDHEAAERASVCCYFDRRLQSVRKRQGFSFEPRATQHLLTRPSAAAPHVYNTPVSVKQK